MSGPTKDDPYATAITRDLTDSEVYLSERLLRALSAERILALQKRLDNELLRRLKE